MKKAAMAMLPVASRRRALKPGSDHALRPAL